MQSRFSLSIVVSVGGLLLVVVACQATVLMKNSLEEMHYRETCARHGAGEEDFDTERTREKLGLKAEDDGRSTNLFCQHYRYSALQL